MYSAKATLLNCLFRFPKEKEKKYIKWWYTELPHFNTFNEIYNINVKIP